MKKTISFLSEGRLLSGLLLAGLFFLLTANSASAQESAQGTVNPYSHIATKLDVTAYPLGTFEQGHSIQVLELIMDNMKPLFSNGGGTLSQKLKYDYCGRILQDIKTRFIAPEITLLTSLTGVAEKTNTIGVQAPQLRSLYNEIVGQLQ